MTPISTDIRMNSTRTYRGLAFANAAGGALLAAGVLAGIVGVILQGEMKGLLLGGILLAVVAIVAASLISAAITHLKRPDQKSALTLAVNSAVLVWFLLGALLGATGVKARWAAIAPGLAFAAAFATYQLYMKPAALRAFPSEEERG